MMTHTLVHVSDVHATRHGELYGSIDGLARLRAVGDWVLGRQLDIDGILITGDLIERGHTDAYPALARELERLERLLGVPVLTTLGNHDDPDAATAALPGYAPGQPAYRAVTVGELRILLLNSAAGELGPAQLDWLAAELDAAVAAAPAATLIALHHPPLPSPMPALAHAHLRDAEPLLQLADRARVRGILAGHYHHATAALSGSTYVSVAPALAYQQVMFAGDLLVSGFDQAMLSLLRVTADTIAASTVHLTHPAPAFSMAVRPTASTRSISPSTTTPTD